MKMSHERSDVYSYPGAQNVIVPLGLAFGKLLSLGDFNLDCNEFTPNQKRGADATFASQIFPMASMHDWVLFTSNISHKSCLFNLVSSVALFSLKITRLSCSK